VLAAVCGKQFSEFKPLLSELAVAKLSPISAEMARAIADPILAKTLEIVGMVR